MSVRLNVNLNEETAAAIRRISEQRNISVTEVIRRMVSTYDFIDNETHAGATIQVVQPGKPARELVLI